MTPHGESYVSTRRVGHFNGAGATGTLAERQAALVATLVAGAPDPPGFDPTRLAAARRALMRKRAGEAAKHWPVLAASFGPRWATTFAAHHEGRESAGGLRDGWDLARALRPELTADAARELRDREARWRYDGAGHPRLRRFRAAVAAVVDRTRRPA